MEFIQEKLKETNKRLKKLEKRRDYLKNKIEECEFLLEIYLKLNRDNMFDKDIEKLEKELKIRKNKLSFLEKEIEKCCALQLELLYRMKSPKI